MSAVLCCGLLTWALSAGGGSTYDASRSLEKLVDLPTAKERRVEAKRLAAIGELSVERWLEAMAEFGEFASLDAGPLLETIPLVVDGKVEHGEVELYVPPPYDAATPAPLLLMLHGSGGSGRGQHMMWKAVADTCGMLVLSPSETGEGEGYGFTPAERERALAALRWARRRANVDENRIFVSGISRGGHAAWDLALRHPDRFAGLFPLIGGPRLSIPRGQNNLRYVENIAQMTIRDLQGAKDDPGLLFDLRLAFDRLREYDAPNAALIEFPDLAHGFRFEEVPWVELLADCARDPLPARVVLRATEVDHARAHWVELTRLGKDVEEVFTPRVNATTWNRLDAAGQKRRLQELVDERTARLEVERHGPGLYRAKGDRVTGFRLLLTQEMLAEEERIEVEFRGKKTRKRPRPSKQLLLTEFAERFDRTFLPVAEVKVGK